ncbi:uncharacterized protein LOC134244621 [Saccostrea cucullata]|uniref:uncharacterized protein LOC134244621 n=1 Tax=Saccostrea cuccullata TaxID=36930 RepID=UPI002ED50F07
MYEQIVLPPFDNATDIPITRRREPQASTPMERSSRHASSTDSSSNYSINCRPLYRNLNICITISSVNPNFLQARELPDEDLSRIPKDLRMEEPILTTLQRETDNPAIENKMFSTGQKSYYNWFGGGWKGKEELDGRKKRAIETYVEHFYPEVKDAAVWRDRVVSRINECL